MLVTGFLVAAMAGDAQAKPTWGGDCADCHGGSRDAMEVEGFDELGGPDNLKVFNAMPGESAQITFNVMEDSSKYGVAVLGLDDPGVVDLSELLAVPDLGSVWSDRGDYYVTGVESGAGVFTFDLAIDPAASPDYYLLSATTAGDGGGRWAQTENFYVRVVAEAVPEPSTLAALMVAGIVGSAVLVRRRRTARQA
ncbi:MAG TPA: PEP-CTERM sorting domain-containing protein [Thermoguttaceae bacterium]|nr:PEP-CTERM sorting domain-containing protein [Thermoguttaceae bacterium]